MEQETQAVRHSDATVHPDYLNNIYQYRFCRIYSGGTVNSELCSQYVLHLVPSFELDIHHPFNYLYRAFIQDVTLTSGHFESAPQEIIILIITILHLTHELHLFSFIEACTEGSPD